MREGVYKVSAVLPRPLPASEPARMRSFPQELVDTVIDQLATPKPQCESNMSLYSTVSPEWVTRTQKYHFERVRFEGTRPLEKWRTAIEPDPFGVSRHVRKLEWLYVGGWLEGFEEHTRAFTRVETLLFLGCRFFTMPSIVDFLAPMGSSLVQLDIQGVRTTRHIFTSLLAALPHLRRLGARYLVFEGDHGMTASPRIPFFENAGALDLRLDPPGSLDWIPPSARVRELQIDKQCILHHPAVIKRCLDSPSGGPEFIGICISEGSDSACQRPWLDIILGRPL